MVGVSSLALLWGSLLGVGLWSLSRSLIPAPRPRLSNRIAPYLLDVSPVARDMVRTRHDDPVVVFGYLLSPTVSRFLARVDSLIGGSSTRAAALATTGSPETTAEFAARRAASGVIGLALGAVAGALGALLSSQQGLTGIAGGALVGFIAGIWWVDNQVSSAVKKRDERILEEFPTILELLGLALAAGDSLPRALARVARRSKGELGLEWARVMAVVDLGAPLALSLRESASRIGGVQVAAFVEHLAQALDQGAPLGEVVSAHARDAKAEYTRSLVDRAGKAEVQMLVPMVLLILPVTVIFAVYPGLQALQFGF